MLTACRATSRVGSVLTINDVANIGLQCFPRTRGDELSGKPTNARCEVLKFEIDYAYSSKDLENPENDLDAHSLPCCFLNVSRNSLETTSTSRFFCMNAL